MMSGQHVLVVDDEPRYLRLIRFNLESAGYRATCAATGEEALRLVAESLPELVLLDIMLPGVDGFEVCQRIREMSMVPIVMLTARGAVEDKVRGLKSGADDYIVKPFSAQELLARVEAVLRRVHPVESPPRETHFRIGELLIDFQRRKVSIGDQEVPVSPTEYRLLCCLAAYAGRVLTHDELLEKVWGPGYKGEHETLRVTVWRLRQKLEQQPMAPRYIRTLPGVGYAIDDSGRDSSAQ